MTPLELKKRIEKLPYKSEVTSLFEKELTLKGMWNAEGTWYKTQRRHWLTWLSEYEGPGFYHRKKWKGRTAEFIYNHIMCPPMLLWLGEGAGVSRSILLSAKVAALKTKPIFPAQCAAIRKKIPWTLIEAQLDS